MNYRKDFERCLEYIEDHLMDKLTVPQLAELIGYSHFHFCRLFHIYTGMTPVNYLLNRRLEKSLIEIMKGRKILDVALEYGFETASGYSKAFRKVYQMTPKAYAQKMKGYMPHKENKSIEGYIMPPKIVEIPDLFIEGYGIKVNLDDPNYEEHMGAFWKSMIWKVLKRSFI